jgi:hypothetical protein
MHEPYVGRNSRKALGRGSVLKSDNLPGSELEIVEVELENEPS